MNAWVPTQPSSVVLLLAILVLQFFISFLLLQNNMRRSSAWLFPLLSVAAVHFVMIEEPPGFRMLALAITLLTGMKVVTAREKHGYRPKITHWFLYCFCWIGMDPGIFSAQKKRDIQQAKAFIGRGVTYITIGSIVFTGLKLFGPDMPGSEPLASYYFCSAVLLVSLSLILHFGLLNLNSGFIRLLGYPAYSLFKSPYRSKSLAEFWGKRWNIPFTEMTAAVIFKPLGKKIALHWAVFCAFLFSGLLHEIAISLPVFECFGLPLLYFFIQAIGQWSERILFRKNKPGLWWVLPWLIVPLPLLFHRPFMLDVIWPLINW